MNFDFSEEQKHLRDETRRFLTDKASLKRARAVLESQSASKPKISDAFDADLWKGLADLGLLGIAIPEQYGGAGAGRLELCIVAEELGRALAPIPFSSSVYLATEALLLYGAEAQKQKWLPKLAAGEAIGALAVVEGCGNPTEQSIRAIVENGLLNGHKSLVADGSIADFAIIVARDGAAGGIGLFLVDLRGDDVEKTLVASVDPTRNYASIVFNKSPAERLGEAAEGKPFDGWAAYENLQDRAAVLCAFEQVGGADRTLEMARDYALERMAFGRPIGSFQAVKHMLADMYVEATLARSNAYYGAWALSTDAPDLPIAAASARVSATQAFLLCAKNNIQTHGGMGFTWEFDCQLFYRRANLLALAFGSLSYWQDQLILRMRNAAQLASKSAA